MDDHAGECRIDQDKVLIECWMGAKWGFYKFPLDPATDQPVIGEELGWREQQQSARRVDAADSVYLEEAGAHVALGFDLDLPLRSQLESAKRFLQARKAKLRREGSLVMKTVRNLGHEWCLMLRILDALNAGESLESVAEELCNGAGQPGGKTHIFGLGRQAERLVDRGYLEILKIP